MKIINNGVYCVKNDLYKGLYNIIIKEKDDKGES